MTTAPATADRLHALDATRAFALLAGVVYHSAWSFLSMPRGAPVADVSANIFFDWFAFTLHAFRMPVFFLIAGFFARLLYMRLGAKGFARHRFLRIAVPLVTGWFILQPLVILAWNFAANNSGANLARFEPGLAMTKDILQGDMFVPTAKGGMFSLSHLWFLYYLLWLYALMLALRAVILRVFPKAGNIADKAVAWLAKERAAIGVLALSTGIFLWRMDGWFGVDTPADSLVPRAFPLAFYLVCFAFGWLLHRRPALLPAFASRWKPAAILGLALSLIIFATLCMASGQGVASGAPGTRYPVLLPTQVADWPRLVALLKSASKPNAPPELKSFWKHVPDWDRKPFLALAATPSRSVQGGLCRNLNGLLSQPGLFGGDSGADDAFLHSRRTLERLAGGAVLPDPRALSWYAPVKLAYSLGYGFVLWLLVYAVIGFFQAHCKHPSRAWRYVADSSYWIYLIHFPLVVALQGWMYDWPLPVVVKFPLLLALVSAVAFSSYHFLVRPSFIGFVLNGRRYPRSAASICQN